MSDLTHSGSITEGTIAFGDPETHKKFRDIIIHVEIRKITGRKREGKELPGDEARLMSLYNQVIPPTVVTVGRGKTRVVPPVVVVTGARDLYAGLQGQLKTIFGRELSLDEVSAVREYLAINNPHVHDPLYPRPKVEFRPWRLIERPADGARLASNAPAGLITLAVVSGMQIGSSL
jgi:hypothetical protein